MIHTITRTDDFGVPAGFSAPATETADRLVEQWLSGMGGVFPPTYGRTLHFGRDIEMERYLVYVDINTHISR